MIRTATTLAVAAVIAATPIAAAQTPPPANTDIKSLVLAAAAYVDQYKKQFASVVADEEGLQTTSGTTLAEFVTQRTRGEMFLAYLENDRAWIGVHDVLELNGRKVETGGRARDILVHGDAAAVKRLILDLNARYNIGSVTRNTNEPMFALLVLDPRYIGNFTFDRVALDTPQAGAPIATLSFSERDRPTMVKRKDGTPLFAKGEIVVEAGTGRILRTALRYGATPLRVMQDTTYVPDERLGLMVPAKFEEYYIVRGAQNREEHTDGVTTYTNYRRFTATGWIKK